MRIERAQPVGELLRQHRNHTTREINRGTALKRIDIQGVVGFDVMTDVGNGDDQTVALRAADLDWLAIDGVIKVARIFTINRH